MSESDDTARWLTPNSSEGTRFGVPNRLSFIGGSDARIIMGSDEAALLRRWQETRSEIEPVDLSQNLFIHLGIATEDLNRRGYEADSGELLKDVQRWARRPALFWLAAALDGVIESSGAVFEAKFMLPWAFSEDGAAEKHTAQLQHNMWVPGSTHSVSSIITGGGTSVEIKIDAGPLHQHILLTAEKRFWRCVEAGEPPSLFGADPPRARIEAVRTLNMSAPNSWAQFAGVYCRTRAAFLEHEKVKGELKALVPDDAKEAYGHGVRAKRSRSGAISFESLEGGHASL